MLELNFPILTYSDKHIRGNIRNQKVFCRSITSFLDRGGFVGDKVIDSQGKQYQILSVTRKGNTFSPWYNLTNRDKFIKIDFEIVEVPNLKFEEVKKILFDLISKNKKWRGAGESMTEVDKSFSQIDSFNDLVRYGFAHGNR